MSINGEMSINGTEAANELRHDVSNAVTDGTAREKVCHSVLPVTFF